MQVEKPSPIGNLILPHPARLHVPFGHNHRTHEPAALACAEDRPDPVKGAGAARFLRLGIGVLHPVPDTQDVSLQIGANGRIVIDGMPRHSELNPPETATRIVWNAAGVVEERAVAETVRPLR
jgi:hypothetical protein